MQPATTTEVRPLTSSPLEVEADALVVGVCEDETPAGPAAQVDVASGGLLGRLIERGEWSGEACKLLPLYGVPGVRAQQVLAVGLGERDALDRGALFRAAGAAARQLAGRPRQTVALALVEQPDGPLTESIVAGALVGGEGQDLYRAERKLNPPAALLVAGDPAGIDAGRIVGESVNFTRRLVNLPPVDLYPESFAEEARQMAAGCELEIEVWDRPRLEEEGCEALLAVSRGSGREPRLVIARHRGAGDGPLQLALVGKGVTFDSGGLSLKSSEGMLAMKCDMAGAATVLGALRAASQLQLPVNVVGVMGLVENMTGPDAYKLGDVLTSRSGTTIEIHNTDAEGRLVLADALDVAVESGAARIVDLATLTGACVVALGQDVCGLMANDQPWCDEVKRAAETCGELVWQLPMFDVFDPLIESRVADIRNTGEGRWGGAITAAKLLARFVGDVPWTHIDIAGPAFLEKPKPWCDAGASGQMVRTLVELLRRTADGGPRQARG